MVKKIVWNSLFRAYVTSTGALNREFMTIFLTISVETGYIVCGRRSVEGCKVKSVNCGQLLRKSAYTYVESIRSVLVEWLGNKRWIIWLPARHWRSCTSCVRWRKTCRTCPHIWRDRRGSRRCWSSLPSNQGPGPCRSVDTLQIIMSKVAITP